MNGSFDLVKQLISKNVFRIDQGNLERIFKEIQSARATNKAGIRKCL